MSNKLKVEIWSDVVCPFCYIGKRRFEHALEKFPNREDVEIEWRSFQLDPEAKYVPGENIVIKGSVLPVDHRYALYAGLLCSVRVS